MRYLLMIYQEPSALPASQAELEAMFGEYNTFGEWATGKGWLRGGEALQDVSAATTVSIRNGARTVTDGPFAETKEHLGGYYLLDAPDLDAAIETAARVPGARTGKVEIRPILEMG